MVAAADLARKSHKPRWGCWYQDWRFADQVGWGCLMWSREVLVLLDRKDNWGALQNETPDEVWKEALKSPICWLGRVDFFLTLCQKLKEGFQEIEMTVESYMSRDHLVQNGDQVEFNHLYTGGSSRNVASFQCIHPESQKFVFRIRSKSQIRSRWVDFKNLEFSPSKPVVSQEER